MTICTVFFFIVFVEQKIVTLLVVVITESKSHRLEFNFSSNVDHRKHSNTKISNRFWDGNKITISKIRYSKKKTNESHSHIHMLILTDPNKCHSYCNFYWNIRVFDMADLQRDSIRRDVLNSAQKRSKIYKKSHCMINTVIIVLFNPDILIRDYIHTHARDWFLCAR